MRRLIIRSLLAHRGRLALTLVAVTLSVSFVTAGFVLADSLRSVFGDVSSGIYDGVDAEIRAADGDFDQLASGQRFPEETLDAAASVPGVESIVPSLGGREVLFSVDDDGVVRPTGPPTLTFSTTDQWDVSPFTPTSGRAPGRGEVMLDATQAEVLDAQVGDEVIVSTPDGLETFTLSGTVTFGDVEAGVIPYFLLFELETMQRLLDAPGLVDSAAVSVEPGVEVDTVVEDLQAALPGSLLVADRSQLVDEQNNEFGQVIGLIQTALLGFAFVTLFVSTFVIANTFAVLVGRQRQQIGMLRAIGASGGQAVGLVVAEAALVGIVASGLGLLGGIAVAEGIILLFETVTTGGFPEGPTLILPRTVAVAVAVGIGVTVASAVVPAIRAGRTSPMEALRPNLAGAVGAPSRTGRALQWLAGATVGRLGPAGGLAATGAARNPRRVLTTALSMIVGLTLIGSLTVLGASYRTTVEDTAELGYEADLIIVGDEGAAVPHAAVAALADLPEVAAAAGYGSTEVLHDGVVTTIAGFDSATADGVVVLDAIEGSTGPLAADQAIITEERAASGSLGVGDRIPVEFSDGAVVDLTVAAVIEPTDLIDSDLLVDAGLIADHARNVDADRGVVRLAEGIGPARGTEVVTRALADRPQLEITTMAEHTESLQARSSQLLALANGLLALTIVVALTGIANTVALSMLERGRELGLLRAVGMTRRQLRTMVRYEAAILSAIGAVAGLALGVGVALVAAPLLPDALVATTTIPIGSLAAYLLISVTFGVLAAALPARRAARRPILDALGADL